MPDLVDFLLLSFTSLFVIVDPIGAAPTFITMTQQDSVRDRIKMGAVASIVTFWLLTLTALGGHRVLKFFGISIPAMQIAGGIVLLLIGLDMLRAQKTPVRETAEETQEGVAKEDVAVTPLAIPMMAGPGALTAVMLLSNRATSLWHHLVLYGNIFLVSLTAYFIFRFTASRTHLAGPLAIKIMTRLMGLLLSAIAVQFILDGIKNSQIF